MIMELNEHKFPLNSDVEWNIFRVMVMLMSSFGDETLVTYIVVHF